MNRSIGTLNNISYIPSNSKWFRVQEDCHYAPETWRSWELNRWFPVPQTFRDKAHTAVTKSQTISVTLAESGDRIGVTAIK